MEKSDQEIRAIILKALIDSAPDQSYATEMVESNIALFQEKTMGEIFKTIGLDSLGGLWFITLLEEQFPSWNNLKMEVFFVENADKYLDDLIGQFKGDPNDE